MSISVILHSQHTCQTCASIKDLNKIYTDPCSNEHCQECMEQVYLKANIYVRHIQALNKIYTIYMDPRYNNHLQATCGEQAVQPNLNANIHVRRIQASNNLYTIHTDPCSKQHLQGRREQAARAYLIADTHVRHVPA